MTDAEQIAARLSEAGKECLDWVRPHSLIAPYRRGAVEIEEKGLVCWLGDFYIITDLGLAVRAIIESDGK